MTFIHIFQFLVAFMTSRSLTLWAPRWHYYAPLEKNWCPTLLCRVRFSKFPWFFKLKLVTCTDQGLYIEVQGVPGHCDFIHCGFTHCGFFMGLIPHILLDDFYIFLSIFFQLCGISCVSNYVMHFSFPFFKMPQYLRIVIAP